MPARHRRIALAAAALAGAATAVAVAVPTVGTGSLSVTGAGVGSITIRGDIIVLGGVSGPGQIEVRTGRSAAVVGMDARRRWIPPNRDVLVPVRAGASFGITAGAPFRVTIRGRGVSATIAGSGAVTFAGRGTYLPYGGARSRPWPRGGVQLRQPSEGPRLRGNPTPATARARTGA